MKNHIKINFPSKSCNESFARMAVAAFVTPVDLTIEQMSDIKTAVSEAVTNSIVHGYEENQGYITLECELIDNQLKIIVSDNGKGIADIKTAMQPLYTSRPEMERSGMGFTVMETFMDSVDVKSSLGLGTTVTMTKFL